MTSAWTLFSFVFYSTILSYLVSTAYAFIYLVQADVCRSLIEPLQVARSANRNSSSQLYRQLLTEKLLFWKLNREACAVFRQTCELSAHNSAEPVWGKQTHSRSCSALSAAGCKIRYRIWRFIRTPHLGGKFTNSNRRTLWTLGGIFFLAF